jgi:hypothetical protein
MYGNPMQRESASDAREAASDERHALGGPGLDPAVAAILKLQRTAGNAAVGRLMRQPRHHHRTAPPAPPTPWTWRPPPDTFYEPPESVQPMYGTGPRDTRYGYQYTALEDRFRFCQLGATLTLGARPLTAEETDLVIEAVTVACAGFPELKDAYLHYYTDHQIVVSTAALGATGGTAHVAETEGGGNTKLASDWRVGMSLAGFGAALMHEFVHTSGPVGGDASTRYAFEGYAYATDLVLAERAGAADRAQVVLRACRGIVLDEFQANFVKAYGTLAFLFDIIDHGRSAVPDDGRPESVRSRLHRTTPAQARQLVVRYLGVGPTHVSDGLLADLGQLALSERTLVRRIAPTFPSL